MFEASVDVALLYFVRQRRECAARSAQMSPGPKGYLQLSEVLAGVPGIGHAIYADDITVWCKGGSLATLEESLQEALDVTERFLEGTGLVLSPKKSELLLFRKARQGMRNLEPLASLPARARAILRSVGSDAKAALFVDAAEYSTRRAFGVSVVDGKGQLVARASVCTDHVTVAEEIAIALALQAAEVPCVVYSDSRSAVRAFSGGLISQQAARLLRSGRRQARWAGGHHISWFPAHVEGIDGVNPNASAHTFARECTNRAGGGEASGGNIDLRKDPLTTFHEITTNYKLSRRRFPLPNARLNRAQGITFRLLQTDTYLFPRTYRRIAPDFPEDADGHTNAVTADPPPLYYECAGQNFLGKVYFLKCVLAYYHTLQTEEEPQPEPLAQEEPHCSKNIA
ncbi:hypothetical protein HPB50_015535 [Hyalomma asiaticum]|uniref:Uncharacterized protein n=1 Tax=Hyalomma asiaticum TaxID=266040 RepID=A0ACB7SI75_HYAAI|nr:hypothetical protein HPB50_015535 [Hyalomma asiaticum]